MAISNYPNQPIDEGGNLMMNSPSPFKANATYNATAAPASSVITLNDNTTLVEVTTSGSSGAVLRWVPVTETAGVSPFASVISSGLTANFDHAIPPNTVRRFAAPLETRGVNSVVGVGVQGGYYRRVAVGNAGGVASILVTEF